MPIPGHCSCKNRDCELTKPLHSNLCPVYRIMCICLFGGLEPWSANCCCSRFGFVTLLLALLRPRCLEEVKTCKTEGASLWKQAEGWNWWREFRLNFALVRYWHPCVQECILIMLYYCIVYTPKKRSHGTPPMGFQGEFLIWHSHALSVFRV